jgi:hypothetical protein
MRTKICIISLLLLIFASFPLQARAAEMNFPAGSLIIPMESFYQDEADGGLLEAYGLAFYLLDHVNTDSDHDITVYWMIDPLKTSIDAPDVVIEDLTLADGKAVAKLYDHHDYSTSGLIFNGALGDNNKKISYGGAPFIINGIDLDKARAIIASSAWDAVEIHEAQVPFAGMVYSEMLGTPPKIALMNNNETDTGNAAILESYLRLAGICSDVYDVVTPCQIRDDVLTEGDGYDFLWAPHWTGYDNKEKDGVVEGYDNYQDHFFSDNESCDGHASPNTMKIVYYDSDSVKWDVKLSN